MTATWAHTCRRRSLPEDRSWLRSWAVQAGFSENDCGSCVPRRDAAGPRRGLSRKHRRPDAPSLCRVRLRSSRSLELDHDRLPSIARRSDFRKPDWTGSGLVISAGPAPIAAVMIGRERFQLASSLPQHVLQDAAVPVVVRLGRGVDAHDRVELRCRRHVHVHRVRERPSPQRGRCR